MKGTFHLTLLNNGKIRVETIEGGGCGEECYEKLRWFLNSLNLEVDESSICPTQDDQIDTTDQGTELRQGLT